MGPSKSFYVVTVDFRIKVTIQAESHGDAINKTAENVRELLDKAEYEYTEPQATVRRD